MSMTVTPVRPKPLTKRDLDREIERLLEEVARECRESDPATGDDDLRPRWIRPADLVRRVLPFTCRN